MEIAKNKQWRSLPTEIVNIIVEFTGCVKLRDGLLVSQISKEDPRRRVLTTIPTITIICYYYHGIRVFLSRVKTTRKIDDTLVEFKIESNIIDTSSELYNANISLFDMFDNGDNIYNSMRERLYKTVTYGFRMNEFGWINRDNVIFSCDGIVKVSHV